MNKLIGQDLVKNKVVSITMVVFITAAAMLLSLSAILIVNLFGSIDRLMQDAMTPHFMQMHSSTVELSELASFAEENDQVADVQTSEFLNVDSSKINIGENSLSGSLQDNGFCTQNKRFDFLLDLNNERVQPHKGQLYVPVCYYKDGTAKIGDTAVVGDNVFQVAGFVRDSQMNSTLASSKRFVVNEADFQALKQWGKSEYLIEFRLHDLSQLGAFTTAYSAAGLPANGPTLTWPLFQMISAFSDGIMIAVILLISFLVIFIAMLCIRFTLLAKMEKDYCEIGVMRAIGLRRTDIRGIYLSIYAALAAIGCIGGVFLSLLLQKPLQESIRLNLGTSGNDVLAVGLGAMSVAILFLFLLLYVNLNLRRLRKISPAQAMRFGGQLETTGKNRSIRLANNRFFSTNLFLGMQDVLARKQLYATMLVVIVLASFMMIVPQNLYYTISDDEFVTYLGVGNCDLRLDIQQTSDGSMDEKAAEIVAYMAADQEIEKYAVFTTKTLETKLENGTTERIKVELGDHTIFPLQYTAGKNPIAENEIALSVIHAEELDKNVGDQITLLTAEGEKQLTICGIYSDITNGGKTAKATFSADTADTAWSIVCAKLRNSEQLRDQITKYTDRFGYAKVSSVEQYVAQTFGQTLQSVRTAAQVAVFVAAAITLLITLLFIRLLVAKDRYAITVMRAIGFTRTDINRQYAWRIVLVIAAGIIGGAILAATLGEKISSMAIASFGAASFHFTINPLFTYVFSPLIIVIAALLATVWGTAQAGEMHRYELVKE